MIRDDDAARSPNPVMQAAALVLALGILPLAVFAAISMGARIDQYGLAPERLWALVAIGVAVAFGVAYLVAVVRGGRPGWTEHLRAANLRLAASVCGLALLLALPILDFGAISARHQLARLEAGRVDVERFDFEALRWNFGAAGRAALARLAEGQGRAAELATLALAREVPSLEPMLPADQARRMERFRVEGGDPAIAERLRGFISDNSWQCDPAGCTALVIGAIEGGTHVVLVSGAQVTHLRLPPAGAVEELALADGALLPVERSLPSDTPPSPGAAVEIRPFSGRQVHVGGRPVGEPFP